MSARPCISVVMPCYNAEQFLAEALESALGQEGVEHEVIVVNDGSTDRSAEILAAYGARLRVVHQENRGRSAARNRGLELARGRYVAFLDSDDWWNRAFLAEMTHALERAGPQCGIAYCGWQNVGLQGGRGAPFVPPDYECAGKKELLLENCRWPIHAALSRTDAVLKAGGFPTELSLSEDFAMWLEVASFTRLVRVPKVLAYYRHHRDDDQAPAAAHWALSHLQAQERFLRRHPDVRRMLGRSAVRRALYGELRRRALTAYWKRDLESARVLFRRLLRSAYVKSTDLPRVLPALLPAELHEAMVLARDRRAPAAE